jgi:hypothetical protein
LNHKKTISLSAIALAVLAAAALAAFEFNRPAAAQIVNEPPPDPDSISFEMFGIATGQTARINVFNANSLDYESHPCSVNIRFVGVDGRVLRGFDGKPIRRATTLPNGQSTALDLNADEVPTDIRLRLQLRAVVAVAPADDSTLAPPCFPSVEVFNNSNGRTQFMVPSREAANPEG